MVAQRFLVLMVTAAALQQVLADGQQNPTPEERLKKKLLEGYDKTTLPQRESNGTTTVRMGVQVQGTWIEEDKQVVHINAWVLLVRMYSNGRWRGVVVSFSD
ncbi:hypothetical protein E2C01_064899 [Portunus trituberculatus]|uniref:Uncharacterized protein n=1 Tax=Portunus trituberculatus TaxID=210409 RepID=A0A5B7HQB0_PORTR|nr:hypothetical protein [Portunus trituberculatus]